MSSLKTLVKRTPAAKRAALLAMRVAATFGARKLRHYPGFFADWWRFRRAGGNAAILDIYPCLGDKTSSTDVDRHYFYQAVWCFERIVASSVRRHLDIGSSAYFVGMLSAVMDVTFVDIRPLTIRCDRLSMLPGTILDLPFEDATIESLSSLHVIEHIGLGRYGDPIAPDGARRAATELQRVTRPNGSLYVTTPIGRSRVQFNSHRVFDVEEVQGMFPRCDLVEFSMVDVRGDFHRDVPLDRWRALIDTTAGGDFGLGLFAFRKNGI